MARNSSNYIGKNNPLGVDGKQLKCFDCQSVYHMKDKCDAKKKSERNEKSEKAEMKEGKRDKKDKRKKK